MREEGRHAPRNIQPSILQLFPVLLIQGDDSRPVSFGLNLPHPAGRGPLQVHDIDAFVVGEEKLRPVGRQRAPKGAARTADHGPRPRQVGKHRPGHAHARRHQKGLFQWVQRDRRLFRLVLKRAFVQVEAHPETPGPPAVQCIEQREVPYPVDMVVVVSRTYQLPSPYIRMRSPLGS